MGLMYYVVIIMYWTLGLLLEFDGNFIVMEIYVLTDRQTERQIHGHRDTQAGTDRYTHACVRAHLHVCTRMRAHARARTHTHTHTHTHTRQAHRQTETQRQASMQTDRQTDTTKEKIYRNGLIGHLTHVTTVNCVAIISGATVSHMSHITQPL